MEDGHPHIKYSCMSNSKEIPDESGTGGTLQPPNATLPGEVAACPFIFLSIHQPSHSSTLHPMKAVPEPQTTDPVDRGAEQPQEAKDDRSQLQQKVTSTVGQFSLYDRFG